MIRCVFASLALAVLAGCSGGYILTVPDELAPAGGQGGIVVRLLKPEFAGYCLPVEDAAVRFAIGQGPACAAYTDRLGYAAVTMAMPQEEGAYTVNVAHMDLRGEEVFASAPLYVWPGERRIVAIDADALIREGRQAATVVAALARGAGIVYFTRSDVPRHSQLRQQLKEQGCPDGPVLMWQCCKWHLGGLGACGLARLVAETRMVSQLPHLRETFPNLDLGITDDRCAARTFAAAGMRAIVIGQAGASPDKISYCDSWFDALGCAAAGAAER